MVGWMAAARDGFGPGCRPARAAQVALRQRGAVARVGCQPQRKQLGLARLTIAPGQHFVHTRRLAEPHRASVLSRIRQVGRSSSSATTAATSVQCATKLRRGASAGSAVPRCNLPHGSSGGEISDAADIRFGPEAARPSAAIRGQLQP